MAFTDNFATAITAAVDSLVSAEKLELANVIYSATSKVGEFADKHNIITDVRNGNLIPIMKKGSGYGAMGASKGDCSMNECDIPTTYGTKKWVIGDYDCRIPICLKTKSEDFKKFWNMYSQTLENPMEEPDKTAYLEFAIDQAQTVLKEATWTKGYHGDTTSSNTLISENNGFWTEADAGDGLKHVLPAGEFTGEQLYNQFAEIYAKAANEDWFEESEMEFVVTRKTAKTLVTWLNSLSDKSQYNCDCIDPTKVVSSRVFGIDNLALFGIPVVSYLEEQRGGLEVGVQPDYKILLISKENRLVGVNTNDHLKQFRMFYDQKDNTIYIDLALQIGTAIPLDEYVYATQATA